jgi:hypothetical protein
MLRLNTASNLTGPLSWMFHERNEVRQGYRLLMHGEADAVEDFQKSCPWYFTFRKLDTGPRSPPPQSHTLRELSTSERNTASRRGDSMLSPVDTSSAAPPAKVVNPFTNLRPMPKRPAVLASPPPATPTLLPKVAGHSRLAPIEIDTDSDASSIVEIIDLPISEPKKAAKSTKPQTESTISVDSRSKSRNFSEADTIDLKRLKRQLGVATRLHSEEGMTEPKIFKYIPTERDRYLQADTECRNQILRRARTHLFFRVLRDLESL